MMIIGLTGGIGSGKSEAARLFAGLGVPVVDTDGIAHSLTAIGQPALQEIATALGDDILNPDGSLNRALLRRRAFADAGMRKRLEAILHPLIRMQAKQQLARNPEAPYQILVVPLLFETGGYRDLIDRSLVIDCDEAQQIRRAMMRSQLSEAEVQAIMAAQLPRNQRLAAADDVIVNDGNLEHLAAQVLEKHEKYIKTCIVSQSIS
jgi:dephospho-CoA kinase